MDYPGKRVIQLLARVLRSVDSATWVSSVLAAAVIAAAIFTARALNKIEVARDEIVKSQRVLDCMMLRGDRTSVKRKGDIWYVSCRIVVGKET